MVHKPHVYTPSSITHMSVSMHSTVIILERGRVCIALSLDTRQKGNFRVWPTNCDNLILLNSIHHEEQTAMGGDDSQHLCSRCTTIYQTCHIKSYINIYFLEKNVSWVEPHFYSLVTLISLTLFKILSRNHTTECFFRLYMVAYLQGFS